MLPIITWLLIAIIVLFAAQQYASAGWPRSALKIALIVAVVLLGILFPAHIFPLGHPSLPFVAIALLAIAVLIYSRYKNPHIEDAV